MGKKSSQIMPISAKLSAIKSSLKSKSKKQKSFESIGNSYEAIPYDDPPPSYSVSSLLGQFKQERDVQPQKAYHQSQLTTILQFIYTVLKSKTLFWRALILLSIFSLLLIAVVYIFTLALMNIADGVLNLCWKLSNDAKWYLLSGGTIERVWGILKWGTGIFV